MNDGLLLPGMAQPGSTIQFRRSTSAVALWRTIHRRAAIPEHERWFWAGIILL